MVTLKLEMILVILKHKNIFII